MEYARWDLPDGSFAIGCINLEATGKGTTRIGVDLLEFFPTLGPKHVTLPLVELLHVMFPMEFGATSQRAEGESLNLGVKNLHGLFFLSDLGYDPKPNICRIGIC